MDELLSECLLPEERGFRPCDQLGGSCASVRVKGRERLVMRTCARSILVRGAIDIVFAVVQYGGLGPSLVKYAELVCADTIVIWD
jgi:hypothetical protein